METGEQTESFHWREPHDALAARLASTASPGPYAGYLCTVGYLDDDVLRTLTPDANLQSTFGSLVSSALSSLLAQ